MKRYIIIIVGIWIVIALIIGIRYYAHKNNENISFYEENPSIEEHEVNEENDYRLRDDYNPNEDPTYIENAEKDAETYTQQYSDRTPLEQGDTFSDMGRYVSYNFTKKFEKQLEEIINPKDFDTAFTDWLINNEYLKLSEDNPPILYRGTIQAKDEGIINYIFENDYSYTEFTLNIDTPETDAVIRCTISDEGECEFSGTYNEDDDE